MMSNGTTVLERSNRKPISGGRPRYAMFNIFLPEIDDPDVLGSLQLKINALVVEIGATGYTLLPPSTGFWVHGRCMVEDRVFPCRSSPRTTITLAARSSNSRPTSPACSASIGFSCIASRSPSTQRASSPTPDASDALGRARGRRRDLPRHRQAA